MQFEVDSSSEFQTCSNYKAHWITTKEIMAIFFSINIAWGKFQELNTRFRLVLNRKASLRMVCSAQHHLITILKRQIRGVGRTFHRGEGKGVLRQFLTHASTKLPLLEHNRLATEIATTGTTLLASIYLFLFRIVPLLLMENAGSKMTMAPVQYLVARLMPTRPIEFSPQCCFNHSS